MTKIDDSRPLAVRRDWLSLAVASMLGFGLASAVQAQGFEAPAPPTIGVNGLPGSLGVSAVLPVVPATPPRAAQGQNADQRYDIKSPADPTASFVGTLKGNDATLEVVVGQGRLLTIKNDSAIVGRPGAAVIAVGDPTVLEFQILPNPRMIRLVGQRPGVTDLSITTPDGETHSFEVYVTYDLSLLRAQLRQAFPDAELRLTQLREHVIIEGQARSTLQAGQIIETLRAHIDSVLVAHDIEGSNQQSSPLGQPMGTPQPPGPIDAAQGDPDQVVRLPDVYQAGPDALNVRNTRAATAKAQIINLLRVPGIHQVLLQVQIAELNRTALRQVGADLVGFNTANGTLFGTTVGGGFGLEQANGTTTFSGFNGPTNSAFGIFPTANFAALIHLMRQNSVVSILAEPNLIAMSGHHANFLAGGEFPVPVPQGAGGVTNNVTIQFKQFGVRLDFLPFVLDDETVRLAVTPEVSTIDFTLGTTLVAGGRPVPGLNTRRTETTVELAQGQTLAISGLLRVDMTAETNRIPGLGDLPILGPFFSNTSHQRIEKELLVMVTPYLIRPMEPNQVPPLPGTELKSPTDCEFYFLNRIEGHTRRNYRPTTDYDFIERHQQLRYNREYIQGPVGLSTECPVPDSNRPSR